MTITASPETGPMKDCVNTDMAVYALYDTDYGSPSVQATLEGPDDFDFQKAQNDYLAKKRKYGFVEYLKRYKGFKRVYVHSVEICHFEQPVRYRKAKEGTVERMIDDTLGSLGKKRWLSMAADAENQAGLLKRLKEKGKIGFQFDTKNPS